MKFRHMAPLVAGAAMMVVASLGVVSTASADTTTTTTPASLSQMQAKLEAELAARQTQLSTLTTDVSSSKTLTASDAAAPVVEPVDRDVEHRRARHQGPDRHHGRRAPRRRAGDVPGQQGLRRHDSAGAPHHRGGLGATANAGTILADGPTITAALAARTSDKGYARVEALFTSLTAKATDRAVCADQRLVRRAGTDTRRVAGQRPRLRPGEGRDPACPHRPRLCPGRAPARRALDQPLPGSGRCDRHEHHHHDHGERIGRTRPASPDVFRRT